jgi:hypothetical protein
MQVGKSAQVTLPIINKSKWERLRINLPINISEQQKIDAIFENLKDEPINSNPTTKPNSAPSKS